MDINNAKIRSLPLKDYVNIAYELHVMNTKRYNYFDNIYKKYMTTNKYVFLGLSVYPEIPFTFEKKHLKRSTVFLQRTKKKYYYTVGINCEPSTLCTFRTKCTKK